MFDAKATVVGGAVVLWFAVLIAGLIGWVLNIVKLVQTGFVVADWTGFEVARVVGVPLAPLGAVLGLL